MDSASRPAASGQGLPDDMDELDVWLAEHADLAVVSEVEQLRAENARLRVKLAEYDKYVGEFTRHA